MTRVAPFLAQFGEVAPSPLPSDLVTDASGLLRERGAHRPVIETLDAPIVRTGPRWLQGLDTKIVTVAPDPDVVRMDRSRT